MRKGHVSNCLSSPLERITPGCAARFNAGRALSGKVAIGATKQVRRVTPTLSRLGTLWHRRGFALLALLSALPSTSAQLVTIYTQAGMNGGGAGDCNDESANLESIVMHLINNSPINVGGEPFDYSGYTVDASINSFDQADLADRLAAATFFFMVDMESTPTGFGATAHGILADFVMGGGVMLMTGTAGGSDAEFLNAVFGWDVSSVMCSEASLNTENAEGTPFEWGSATLDCPSATDHLNCGSQQCTPIYGTRESNVVSILPYGEGKVVYVGFDYFNTGYAEYIAQGSGGMHQDCANNVDPYVTDVLPFSVRPSRTGQRC